MNNSTTWWNLKKYTSQKALRFSLSWVGILIIIVCVSFPFLPSTGAQIGVLFALLACCLLGNFIAVKCLAGRGNDDGGNASPSIVVVGMTMQGHPNQVNMPGTHTYGVGAVVVPEEPPPPPYVAPPSYDEIINSDKKMTLDKDHP